MTVTAQLRKFAVSEAGAVTVDWVVLTAAIVGLGIAVVASVRSGVGTLGSNIERSLSSTPVGTTGATNVLSTTR
ncbi:MAG: hypothetical protein ACXIUW_17880 [Roseinatronobacter sp.]